GCRLWARELRPPVRRLAAQGDPEASPTLSTEELALIIPPRNFIQALRVTSTQPHELRKAFDRLDIDESGTLCFAELRALIAEVKSHATDEELDRATGALLARYDRGKDGALSFKEFEEAVLSIASPVDPRAYALAAAIGIAFAGFSVTFPMGPTLIQTFGMSQLQFGTLTTAFAIAKLCGNIPSSILSEAYGRKPLLVGGLLSIATGIAGVAFASCYEQLMVLRLAVGLGVASTFTSAGMYVTDISHPLNSARTRAPMQMGMSAGLLCGPALGGYLLEHVGLYSMTLGVGAASLATATAVFALLPETHRGYRDKRPLRGVGDTLRSWSPILRGQQFRSILSFGWCYNAAFWGAMALLPLVYVDLSLSPSVVGGLSTFNAIISLAVTPVVARSADHLGKMAVVLPGAIVYGAGLILVPHVSSLLELLPVLAAMQVGACMCAQAQMHAMDLAPVKDRAKVPSLWNTFGDTGMLFSSFTSSVLAEAFGLGSAFYADGVLLLVASGGMFIMSRR
ncbi:CAL, partial [Symbiodinium microadriaticum]